MKCKTKFKWDLFARHLRAFRKKKGYGVREGSRALKVRAATWCTAEQGYSIAVPTFLTLCRWMRSNPFQYMSRR